MRHRVATKTFSRDTNGRKALFKSLMVSLFEQGEIVTTQAKGKMLKRLADKCIRAAQTDSVASRRQLHKVFGKRDVVNTLVDRIAPAIKDRQSGFVKIAVVGNRRGDNSLMVKVALVSKPETMKTFKSLKVHAPKVKATPKAAKPEVKTKAETKAKTEKVVAAKKPAAKKKTTKKVAK